jgi:YfiR/HmsC-like
LIDKGLYKIILFSAKLRKLCGMALFFLLIIPPALQAQNTIPLEYQLKAAFLFNFTRFINWPSQAFNSPDDPFVIGIAGNDPFGSYLDAIVEGEQVAGHHIVVVRYHDVKDIPACQILFIDIKEPAKVKEILAMADRRNTLTVSDADNFTNWGGDVQFFKEENKIKIEINIAAAKAAQLEISSKLLRVAKVN